MAGVQHERAVYDNKVRIPWRSGSLRQVPLDRLDAGALPGLIAQNPELELLPDLISHMWHTDRHQQRPIEALAGTWSGAMHLGRVRTLSRTLRAMTSGLQAF